MIYLIILIMLIAGVIGHDLRLKGDDSREMIRRSPRIGVLSAGRYDRRNVRWSKVFFGCIIAVLTIVAGLRYRLGFDTASLEISFNGAPLIGTPDGFRYISPLRGRMTYLYSFVKWLGGGVWVVQLVCAAILNVSVGLFIIRHTRRIFTALTLYCLLYYVNFNFEVMNQGVALAMLLLGYDDMRERRYVPFYIKIIIGSFFHASLLIMAFLPLVDTVRARRMLRPGKPLAIFMAVIAAIAVLLYFTAPLIVSQLVKLEYRHNYIFAQISRFCTYLMTAAPVETLNWKGIAGRFVTNICFPLAAGCILWRPAAWRNGNNFRITNADEDAGLAQMMILSAAFGILSFFIVGANRFEMYFSIFLIVGYVRVQRVMNAGLWWLLISMLIALKAIGFTSRPAHVDFGRTYDMYYPYSSWIDKKEVLLRDSIRQRYDKVMTEITMQIRDENGISYDTETGEIIDNRKK